MPRRVIVTGGSRGFGLGIVRRLVHRARPAHAARSLQFVSFDLSEISAVGDLVKSIRREGGPIYGLVNNAAVGASSLLALMATADIEGVVRLNTLSPTVLTTHVIRHMLADGAGRMINVASIVGFTGYRGRSVYSATKASLIGLTRSLAREVGRLRVTVNGVAPGFLDTEMTQGLDAEHRAPVIRRSALQRLPAIEDVANAVAFLLGAGTESITGTVLTVDAGRTA
jgi:3-oxoacyl-[acyl-carrier protein] reductase